METDIIHIGSSAYPIQELRDLMAAQHYRLGQLDKPTGKRTFTAKNYNIAINDLAQYLEKSGEHLPTRSVLEDWGQKMTSGEILSKRGKPYAVRSVNAKLSAVRKLLRGVANDVMDMQLKMALRDWADIPDVKATTKQDRIESDYGLRLTLEELQGYIQSIPVDHHMGLRDRALVAVMAGTGLRVTEAVSLQMRDVFLTWNDQGQRAVHVRRGKHNKSRVVVVDERNSWVLQAVAAYAKSLGLIAQDSPLSPVFYGVVRLLHGQYKTNGKQLSARSAQRAVSSYSAMHDGQPVHIASHDLRRTFAKLCHTYGMKMDAIREQMGHSSVKVTEDYIGKTVDWIERQAAWTIDLDTPLADTPRAGE